MFFLAGLLGMMALGSVAIVSTYSPELDGDADDQADTPEDDPQELESAPTGSLFEQMGLINMPVDGADDEVSEDIHQQPEPGSIAVGTDEADTMTGTDATDLMGGMDGDDLLDGGADTDELRGGDGDDTLLGGEGDDSLHGEAEDDAMYGDAGDDTLFGHEGEDSLFGGDGDDELQGGLDSDALYGEGDDDALHGREGDDTLDGGLGYDTLFGGWDNDLLNGVVRGADGTDIDQMDFLNGGDGDDTIGTGAGDIVSGGAGADVLVLGDWIVDEAAELADFDNAEDQIVIVYDDTDGGPDPELEIRPMEGDPELTEILVDGVVLTVLPTEDAPTMDQIVLVGESAAGDMAFG
ncbi:calcium-binding protein [Tropicibacter naphthalenivorans]|uniref:Hemolysin, plasmid n=1 Tax=Tropicibacter naphthalenivorans TaxID=441103 RepID=A0A0P1G947_9RHOB|nr:calcium-binding protein [Tropicibacter naphthalenivorans]CUH78098.1 Hemolysin, plasmid [Tropicibacter naphthalenivorans]SMC93619.1 Hemolysin-type calcium-binding repeat-containing protein [Tropicibacter naphthalenivorans]